MINGWFSSGDQSYYADQAGHIVTGAYTIDKQMYYFNETGALVRNQEIEVDGVLYQTTEDGIMVKVESAMADAGEGV